LISAKCITYGRVDTLEESLYSFINQDYPGKKELIIVNDYPLQELVFDHPDVKIYNLKETFSTIGEKENFAISKCSGDIIAVWDDDDVALPNHLSNIAKYFKEDTDLLHWHRGVFFNNKEITSITGLGNSGIVYSKRIWKKLGGHPLENAGYDMTFVMSIRHNSQNVVFAAPSDDEVSWFYMWGGRSYHMSGQGTDDNKRPNVIVRHSEHIESLRKNGKIPTGRIELKPKWKVDYKQQLIDFNGKNKSSNRK
jgi:glycosyltransferase involved in cell wall biosynthesis